ncbi:MAG: hypothetical protein NXI07_15405, partial [bacterium]|nr:hypothetical protein [bacterium]
QSRTSPATLRVRARAPRPSPQSPAYSIPVKEEDEEYADMGEALIEQDKPISINSSETDGISDKDLSETEYAFLEADPAGQKIEAGNTFKGKCAARARA